MLILADVLNTLWYGRYPLKMQSIWISIGLDVRPSKSLASALGKRFSSE